MRISYDKESGAFTVYLREGKPDDTEDSSEAADVYVDAGAEGRVLSFETCGWPWRHAAGARRSLT